MATQAQKAAAEKAAAEAAETERLVAEKKAADEAEALRLADEKAAQEAAHAAEAEHLAAEQADREKAEAAARDAELKKAEDEEDRGDALFNRHVKARLKALLTEHLALAERDEKNGPGGTGWTHNETKREEVAAWATFLRFAAERFEEL